MECTRLQVIPSLRELFESSAFQSGAFHSVYDNISKKPNFYKSSYNVCYFYYVSSLALVLHILVIVFWCTFYMYFHVIGQCIMC